MGRIEISTEHSRPSDLRRILPGLVISLISLAVVLYLAKPAKLYQALRLADLRLVLAAVGIALLWLTVRSIAWRTLLRNKAEFIAVFFTVNEGYLLNNVLPFRLGEVARGFLLSHKSKIPFWEVLPTIVIERVLDLAIAAGLLLATLPFVVGANRAQQAAIGATGLVLAGLLALYLLARNRAWALAKIEKLSARWPTLRRFTGRSLEAFIDGLAILTDGRLFLKAVAWFILNWMIALGQYYLLLLAFIPQATLTWAAFILGAAALGVAAPSSPGAVGVYELAVVGALALLGVDAATGLAFALTAHLTQYLVVGLLGTIGLARDGESLISLYGQVRRISQTGDS